jgi:hypothetical protein
MDRLAVRHWFAFGHFVIDPFPLALNLHTTLRRWMAKARIHFRERAITNLVQHDHSHGGFLVGRRVGHCVRVAAGQKVHRTFR